MTESSDRLSLQLGKISETLVNFQKASEDVPEDKVGVITAHSLKSISDSIKLVQESLNEPKVTDNLLAENLQALSQNLDSKTLSQKTTSQEIVLQLSKIVDGMAVMNRELEEVSEASQEKAKWFTRLTKKEMEGGK